MSSITREKRSFRRSEAYPCSYFPCGDAGTWVETRVVTPNGGQPSLGFYGWCEKHYEQTVGDAR